MDLIRDVILASPFAAVAAAVPTAGLLYLSWYCIYNAFFHHYAKYPGPFLAKFTNLYAAYHAWVGDIHLDMYRCHQKYGDAVRYAPNRLMVNTLQAVTDCYGHQCKVKKFKGYKALSHQAANTLTLQDKTQHARRRRVVSQAFSEANLRVYEPKIMSRVERFCEVVRTSDGQSETPAKVGEWTQPMDLANTFNHLAFDSMTAVSFDHDYNTLASPRYRWAVHAIETSNIRLGTLLQSSALAIGGLDRYLFAKSIVSRDAFVRFIKKLMGRRMQAEEKTGADRDIFSFLQKCTDPETGKALSMTELSTETATFIVAGSDTTSTTMAAVAHYLTGSPAHYRRAAEEVRSTFSSLSEVRLGAKLNSCVFIRACIDESLRLSPPGGSAPWREVEGPTGTSIDGRFVPAGAEVGVCIYAIHHSEACWPDALKFKPERWLKSEGGAGVVGPRQAYLPFGMGARSCVGKPLALQQIMLTFAKMFWEFDFRRVEDVGVEGWEDGEGEPTEYELEDHVTATKRGPILCFKPRV